MREIWKSIKEFEGLYSVSNLGNIKHDKTDAKGGIGNYAKQEHLLKQRKNNKGYMVVELYKENKRRQLLVHRIVASTFLENPHKYKVVNHKDENPLNNSVDNLEWCSQKYNMNYGTVPYRIGKANSKRVEQYDKYGNKLNTFSSTMEAQRLTGVRNSLISEVACNKRKTAGGYIWKYVK